MRAPAKTWIEVSGSALRKNFTALKRRAKGALGMAVVKSNAYGHGLAETVTALKDHADWFGVDSVDEADAVRKVARATPILILGFTRNADLLRVARKGYRIVAYDLGTLRALSRAMAAGRKRAPVHIKVETGTSRQGVPADELPKFLSAAGRLPGIRIEGVSTHFANIEDTDDPTYAREQLRRFGDALKTFGRAGITPDIRHTACSAAALLYPATHFDLVRAGIATYGLWPSDGTRHQSQRLTPPVRLRPALTWKTCIAQVKRIPKGTPVSYGLTERVRRDSVIAVLPVGYWDGFDRGLSSAGEVLVRGGRAKVIGRVCMNMTVVDVTDIKGVMPEDTVVIIGRQGNELVSAEDIADRIGTINYEVVTRINPRIPRILT